MVVTIEKYLEKPLLEEVKMAVESEKAVEKEKRHLKKIQLCRNFLRREEVL